MHTKEEIDNWLKQTGKNRAWLADQCGVSPGRVYIWFSKNSTIPAKAQIIIDKLMEEGNSHRPAGACEQRLNLTLNLDAATYGIFAVRAREDGYAPTPEGISQWIIKTMHHIGTEFPDAGGIIAAEDDTRE